MKRLTDERIAVLIDMVPLNKPPSTIVDIKSALVELQERRKADVEPVAWLHANNSIGIPAITVSKKVADDWYQNGLSVQPLYTAAQFPDLKSEKANSPVARFDNEYIRTRLQVFDDTDEIVGWLSELADEYQEAEYDLREAVTSLCEMYADLKDFGNELMRLQKRRSGWNACRAAMLNGGKS